MVCSTKTRQPRLNLVPYRRKPRTRHEQDAAVTSAHPTNPTHRQNLTLNDWLTVYAYIDAHPGVSQGQVVHHFKMRPQGALIFTQATLSRKIKNRDSLEQRVLSHPNALSSKRPRVVTRPDVEEALVEWITSMELKGEPYTWAMLQEKRRTMEEKLGVPEAERLTGSGWIASFRRTYCIKECHGEADSCGGDGRGTVASGFIGAPPAIDEPSAEKNVGETAVYDDDAIVSEIQRRQAIRSGEPAEDDDDDDDDDEDGDDRPQPSTTELMECCKKLEDAYIARLHADSSLDFLHNLRVFRGVLRREGKQKVKQTILDSFWNTK